MCEKIITKGSTSEVDPCMVDEINSLKTVDWNKKFMSIMSCCGHGKYSKTLIVKNRRSGYVFEWFSGISLTRSKRQDSRAPYYVRDSEGHYYIPEVGKYHCPRCEKIYTPNYDQTPTSDRQIEETIACSFCEYIFYKSTSPITMKYNKDYSKVKEKLNRIQNKRKVSEGILNE